MTQLKVVVTDPEHTQGTEEKQNNSPVWIPRRFRQCIHWKPKPSCKQISPLTQEGQTPDWFRFIFIQVQFLKPSNRVFITACKIPLHWNSTEYLSWGHLIVIPGVIAVFDSSYMARVERNLWELTFIFLSYFHYQGLHDQSGVLSEWILTTQCSHHFF